MSTDGRVSGLLTLKARLLLIGAGILLCFLGLAWSGALTMRYYESAYEMELHIDKVSSKLQKAIKSVNELALSGGSRAARQALSADAVQSAAELDRLTRTFPDGDAAAIIKKTVLPLVLEANGTIERLLKFDEEKFTAARGDALKLAEKSVKGLEAGIAALDSLHAKISGDAEKEAGRTLMLMGTGAIAALAAIALLLGLLYRSIVVPVNDLARFAKEVSAGDLSLEMPVRRNDEIGMLARDMNILVKNLRNNVAGIKNLTGQLGANVNDVGGRVLTSEKDVKKRLDEQEGVAKRGRDAGEKLARLTGEVGAQLERMRSFSNETAEANAQIAESIGKVADKSGGHAILATDTARNIKTMFTSLSNISQSMQQLTATSEELAAAITQMQATVGEVDKRASESNRAAADVYSSATLKGLTAVKSAEDGMGVIEKSMTSLTDAIRNLEARSSQIGFIVDLIDDVADQTALLALNAAILAAQAGKHGEGFAVVAEEVKALAGRTSSSTREIANLIKAIQSEAAGSVKMAHYGIDSVNDGIRRFEEVRQTLEEISSLSARSKELSNFIETAMGEQTGMSMQIFQSIHHISEEVEAVSGSTFALEQQGRAILDSIDQMRADSVEMSQITHQQLEDSKRILKASGAVAADAEIIVDHMQDVKSTSGEVGQIVRSLHEGALSLGYQVSDLGNFVRQFDEQTGKVLGELGKLSV